MRIQNLSTSSGYSLSSGYVTLNIINFTSDSNPQFGENYQTEDIYLIADNCPAFDNIPIYIEVVMWNYTGGYIYNIRNANTDAILSKNTLVNCGTEFLNGVDLIRRVSKKNVFGLTTPLITLSSGAKMGKTEKGAIWVNKKMLSPYDY